MSNDPCMDSLGYPFGDVRYIARRTPSDPRTGCSFIICRILTFLELRLGDLVSSLGWEICWMEYIWDEKPPCVIPRTTAPAIRLSFFTLDVFFSTVLTYYCSSLYLLPSGTPRYLIRIRFLTLRRSGITPGVAVGLSSRGNVLVDLRAGWALCGRGCILSMGLGWLHHHS